MNRKDAKTDKRRETSHDDLKRVASNGDCVGQKQLETSRGGLAVDKPGDYAIMMMMVWQLQTLSTACGTCQGESLVFCN